MFGVYVMLSEKAAVHIINVTFQMELTNLEKKKVLFFINGIQAIAIILIVNCASIFYC